MAALPVVVKHTALGGEGAIRQSGERPGATVRWADVM